MRSEITYEYTTDGRQTVFPIVWPFIHQSYVKITLDGDSVGQSITWVNEHFIQFSTPPPKGSKLVITRQTPQDDSLVQTRDGASITAEDLRTNQRQALHVMQETTDYIQILLKDLLDSQGNIEAIKSMRVVVEEAEEGEPILANYNPDTNTLTLQLPRGRQGVQGKQGDKGDPGDKGEPGEEGKQGPPGPSFTVGVIDCGYVSTIPLIHIDAGYPHTQP